MAKETIRDFGGRIMGTIEDMGGKKVARDFYGRILGTYDYGDGKTRDFHGRVVANGDTLAGLISFHLQETLHYRRNCHFRYTISYIPFYENYIIVRTTAVQYSCKYCTL